jgi:hypothetical protein
MHATNLHGREIFHLLFPHDVQEFACCVGQRILLPHVDLVEFWGLSSDFGHSLKGFMGRIA